MRPDLTAVILSLATACTSAGSAAVEASPPARQVHSAAVNVTDFGASGDGVTDDTAAIQAAANAISDGVRLVFPWGTYKLNSAVTISKDVEVYGGGSTITVGTNQAFTLTKPARVQGFAFESTAAGTGVAVAIYGDAATLSGTRIVRNRFGRTTIVLRDGSLDATASNAGIVVEGNIFSGDYTGAVAGDTYNLIDVRGAADVFIRGNQARAINPERFIKVSGSSRRVHITDNSLTTVSGANGKQAIDLFSDSREVVITGNVFDLAGDPGHTACVENKNGAGSAYYGEPSEVIIADNICKMARADASPIDPIALFGPWSVSTTRADAGQPEGSLSRYTAAIANNLILLTGGTSPGALIVVRGLTGATVTGNVLWRDSTPTFTAGVEVSNCRQTVITGNAIEYGYITVSGAASHPGGTTYTGQPEQVAITGNTIRAFKSQGAVFFSGATIPDAIIEGNAFTSSAASGSNGFVYLVNSTITRLTVRGNTGSVDVSGRVTLNASTVAHLNHSGNGWQSEAAVSADKGDTSPTITVGSDPAVVQFATTLTQNRIVTLSATGATNGDTFRIVRTGLGAFTLDVGGLKTIPSSTAAFVDVTFDGSAWRLTGYGPL